MRMWSRFTNFHAHPWSTVLAVQAEISSINSSIAQVTPPAPRLVCVEMNPGPPCPKSVSGCGIYFMCTHDVTVAGEDCTAEAFSLVSEGASTSVIPASTQPAEKVRGASASQIDISPTSTSGFACLSDEWPLVADEVRETVFEHNQALMRSLSLRALATAVYGDLGLSLQDGHGERGTFPSVQQYREHVQPNDVKMRHAQVVKYSDVFLRSVLLSTGDAQLISNEEPAESLMRLRTELRSLYGEGGRLRCEQCGSRHASELHVAGHVRSRHPRTTWCCYQCQRDRPREEFSSAQLTMPLGAPRYCKACPPDSLRPRIASLAVSTSARIVSKTSAGTVRRHFSRRTRWDAQDRSFTPLIRSNLPRTPQVHSGAVPRVTCAVHATPPCQVTRPLPSRFRCPNCFSSS